MAAIWGGKAAPTRRFCDTYYDFLEGYIGRHSDAIHRGIAVPPGEGFRYEEALMRRMYADPATRQTIDMRMLTDTDIDWICKIKRIACIEPNAPVFRTGADTGILYCLSGGRFPWGCLGREISLLQGARLAVQLAVKLCRMKWRRIFRTAK